MNGAYLFLQLFRGVWAIDPQAAQAAFPTVKRLLDGESFPQRSDALGEDSPYLPFAYSPASPGYYSGFEKAQPGSIGVIPVIDVLMKYDQDCGPVGTASIAKWISQAENSPNIDAIVLKIDSPGGTVDGTQTLADTIANCSKPVVAFVDGMMCSAAYWIGSSADVIISSTTTDIIGSIGTMMSWGDAQPYFEKMGYKFHDVYADASYDKNKIFDQANGGNYKPLKQKLLNPTNDVFVGAVEKNRDGKLTGDMKGVLSGEVFMAEIAVANGLIDGIGTFEMALERAQSMADIRKSNPQNKNESDTMKFNSMLKNVLGFFNIKAEDAEKTDVTDEHLEKLEAELQLKNELQEKLNEQLDFQKTLASRIDTLTAEAEHLTEERDGWKTKAEKYGKLSGAKQTEVGKDKDDITSVASVKNDDEFEIDWTAEHNKDLAARHGKKVVNGKLVD